MALASSANMSSQFQTIRAPSGPSTQFQQLRANASTQPQAQQARPLLPPQQSTSAAGANVNATLIPKAALLPAMAPLVSPVERGFTATNAHTYPSSLKNRQSKAARPLLNQRQGASAASAASATAASTAVPAPAPAPVPASASASALSMTAPLQIARSEHPSLSDPMPDVVLLMPAPAPRPPTTTQTPSSLAGQPVQPVQPGQGVQTAQASQADAFKAIESVALGKINMYNGLLQSLNSSTQLYAKEMNSTLTQSLKCFVKLLKDQETVEKNLFVKKQASKASQAYLDALTKQKAQLEEKVAACQKAVEQSTRLKIDHEAREKMASEKLLELTNKLTSLSEKLVATTVQYNKSKEELEALTTKVKQCSDDLSFYQALKSKIEKIKETLTGTETMIQAKTNEYKQLCLNIEQQKKLELELKKNLSDLKSQFGDEQQALVQIRGSLDHELHKNDQVEVQIQSAVGQFQSLKKRIDVYQNDLKALESKIKSSNGAYETKLNQVSNAEMRYQTLKSQLHVMENTKSLWAKEEEAHQLKMSELKHQFDILSNKTRALQQQQQQQPINAEAKASEVPENKVKSGNAGIAGDVNKTDKGDKVNVVKKKAIKKATGIRSRRTKKTKKPKCSSAALATTASTGRSRKSPRLARKTRQTYFEQDVDADQNVHDDQDYQAPMCDDGDDEDVDVNEETNVQANGTSDVVDLTCI